MPDEQTGFEPVPDIPLPGMPDVPEGPGVSTGERTVNGWCPVGCGRTLALTDNGDVACVARGCRHSFAVADLLADSESGHIVWLGAESFTIRHPLRERLGDELLDCALHEYVKDSDGPPVKPGKYRAVRDGEGWAWTDISGEVTP